MGMTNGDIASIAARYGHSDVTVEQRGQWFVASCSCGYKSTSRQSQALAVDAAAHHLRTIVARARAAGARLRPSRSDDSEGKGAHAPAAAAVLPAAMRRAS